MNPGIYFGRWSSREDLLRAWDGYADEAAKDLDGADVLFATYAEAGYEGYATVVFRSGVDLFEVQSSHCSCDGLAWHAEPITWAYLAAQPKDRFSIMESGPDAVHAWVELVECAKAIVGVRP